MLHIVKLLERRYPKHSSQVAPTLAVLSGSALLLGLGLLLLR